MANLQTLTIDGVTKKIPEPGLYLKWDDDNHLTINKLGALESKTVTLPNNVVTYFDIYTIPYTGWLIFNYSAYFNPSATGVRYSKAYLDNAPSSAGQRTPAAGAGSTQHNAATLFEAPAGSKIRLEMFQNSGASMQVRLEYNGTIVKQSPNE